MTAFDWIALGASVLLPVYIVYAFRPSTWRATNAAIDRANARAEAKIRVDELGLPEREALTPWQRLPDLPDSAYPPDATPLDVFGEPNRREG